VFHITFKRNSNHSLKSLATITAMQCFLETQTLSNLYGTQNLRIPLFRDYDAASQGEVIPTF
jgi:hypothetical protein